MRSRRADDNALTCKACGEEILYAADVECYENYGLCSQCVSDNIDLHVDGISKFEREAPANDWD